MFWLVSQLIGLVLVIAGLCLAGLLIFVALMLCALGILIVGFSISFVIDLIVSAISRRWRFPCVYWLHDWLESTK